MGRDCIRTGSGCLLSVGVQGEAKQMGQDHIRMGGGHLLRVGVQGEAKQMGRDRIRMGGGRLGWLSSVGVRGEAKQWHVVVVYGSSIIIRWVSWSCVGAHSRR